MGSIPALTGVPILTFGFSICYGSQSLEATNFVPSGRCRVRCPGDDKQICGGNVAANSPGLPRHLRSKRAVSSSILLTVYSLAVSLPNTTATGGFIVSGTAPVPLLSPSNTETNNNVTRPTNIPGLGVVTVTTSVVTTVTYTTVNPVDPTAFIAVELCTTLFFEDVAAIRKPLPRSV